MNMPEDLVGLLIKALRCTLSRKETVREFQQRFWNNQLQLKGLIGQDAYDIVADLAHDLDFFEPDPSLRAQDTTYYGHQRLEREIETALQRLSQSGISVPEPYDHKR